MKIAALYARVSTGNQEKQETILSQIDEIKRRIASDGNILGENLSFCDDGWTGSVLARPELDRLRDAAKNGLFQVLYIYDLGRLSRNYTDQLVLVAEIQKYGIAITSLKDVVSGDDEGDDNKWLHSRVVGMFQEFERRKISERFRRGKLYKAKAGLLFGWNAPYGYTYIRGDKKKSIPGSFVINDTEAKVVKQIFQWFTDEALTIRQIIKRLYEQKIIPRKNKDGHWATSTLSRLLRDKTYIGTTYFNKKIATIAMHPRRKDGYRKIKKTSRKDRPSEEWLPITVPVIINLETYDRAQQQLKLNSQFSMRNKVHEYLLSTLIHCGCGNTRAGEGVNENLYYRCTDRVNRFPLPKQCNAPGVNATVIDGIVWNEIKKLMTQPALIKRQYERWKTRTEAEQRTHDYVNVDMLKTELQGLEEEESRYMKAYGSGYVSLEQLKPHLEDVKLKKSQIMGKLTASNHNESNTQQSVILPDLKQFCDKMKSEFDSLVFKERQYVIRQVVESVVTDGATASVKGFIPLTVPEEKTQYKYEQRSIHRHRRASQRREKHAFQRASQKTGRIRCQLPVRDDRTERGHR